MFEESSIVTLPFALVSSSLLLPQLKIAKILQEKLCVTPHQEQESNTT